jgi:hypothetical protein
MGILPILRFRTRVDLSASLIASRKRFTSGSGSGAVFAAAVASRVTVPPIQLVAAA